MVGQNTMNTGSILSILSGLFLFCFFSFSSPAQNSYSVNAKVSDLTIYGTSSLHDWEVVAEKMLGTCTAVIKGGMVESIAELDFNVIVDGLKSGKSGMDDNTYKALKEEKYPNISYKLESIVRTAPSKDGVSTIIVTKGTLTVAGFSKEIELKVAGKPNSDGSIQFIGRAVFNMTDYKIDPPTAVFGSIKTGDEITIVFKIVYS